MTMMMMMMMMVMMVMMMMVMMVMMMMVVVMMMMMVVVEMLVKINYQHHGDDVVDGSIMNGQWWDITEETPFTWGLCIFRS